jgi:hypothetical protein
LPRSHGEHRKQHGCFLLDYFLKMPTDALTSPARARARFQAVDPENGHYESFYLRAFHPSRALAVWIRYTVHKYPHTAPKGAVWFTLFDPSAGPPRAAKSAYAFEELAANEDLFVAVGSNRLEPACASGKITTDRLSASWRLEFDQTSPPLHHLPRRWMYERSFPRTKLESPYPMSTFSGELEVDGQSMTLDGWPGMVGHNWGREHAKEWVWLSGLGFDADPQAFIDVALARVRVGPVTLPWIATGWAFFKGAYHRLGGPGQIRSTRINPGANQCDFSLSGPGVTARGTCSAPLGDFAGWIYSSPDGSARCVSNCSAAAMNLELDRSEAAPVTLTTQHGAAYELGLSQPRADIPIQPFADP